VQEVKAGQVNAVKLLVNAGDVDENAKSKTWFVLQHQQAAQSRVASKKTWAKRIPYSQIF